MAKENIYSEIRNIYFELTEKEKRVANYILEDSDKVNQMSISDLAEACGTSDATVTRFVKHLKCGSYSAFKLSLVEAARPHVTEVRDSGNMRDVLLSKHATVLQQTAESLDMALVGKAARMLYEADHVYVVGRGPNSMIAECVLYQFSLVSSKFSQLPDSWLQVASAAYMTPKDVVLIFSYSGTNHSFFEEVLPLIRRKKVQVILVTSFPKCLGATLADVVISTNLERVQQPVPEIYSRVSQLFIVDALYQAYIEQNPQVCLHNTENVKKALRTMHAI
ncbi:MAG: MurR/RpiR family transcriptional regulator [Lachnospiraceae bacterium]|nr:MurR/RpiR family transcriptional regulator [Lachnospiraceae bacterium]